MSGATLTTLFVEAFGSTSAAAIGGQSGQTLQTLPFTGGGSTIQHLDVAITLPSAFIGSVDQQMFIGDQNLMEVQVVLPSPLTSDFSVGFQIPITLPTPTGSLHITPLAVLRPNLTLPPVSAALDILAGSLMEVDVTLPLVVATVDGQGWLSGMTVGPLALPPVQAAVQISQWPHIEIAGRLPAVEAAITAFVAEESMHIAVILPAALGGAPTIDLAVLLPAVRAALDILSPNATRQTWVMNIENSGITQFNNFEFKQFGRAFNQYYAVGMSGGLYTLGGDTDASTPISWSWETGLSDLGSRGLKGLLGTYFDGIFERKITFTVVGDSSRWTYYHTVRGNPEDRLTQRVSLGRGIRTVNVGFGMAGVGPYFELDSVTPEYVISDRNLGRNPR
jgi:hypothetical protein